MVCVLALAWGNIEEVRFAVGLRTDGFQGHGIIFNRWGTTGTTSIARITGFDPAAPGDLSSPFIRLRRPFDWHVGNYTMRVAQDGPDNSDRRWFGYWIRDKSTNVETHPGSLKFPVRAEGNPQIQARSQGTGSLIAVMGDGALNPYGLPVFEAALALPDASGGDYPDRATVNYSSLHGVMTNSNVR